jgi:Putative Ig domain
MSRLSWVTTPGTIASLAAGLPATVSIIAVDSSDFGANFTYQLINGNLPAGLILNSSGTITGTPTYDAASNNFTNSISYNFLVRAKSTADGSVIDGKFTIIVNDYLNTGLTWETPAGNLGTIPVGNFYQYKLLVVDTNPSNTVSFSFISGQLPPGMQVTKDGYLQGVPELLDSVTLNKSETFKFSIRAKNSQGMVQDQGFSLTITNIYGPIIEPSTTNLGTFFDGSFYNRQLYVVELNPTAVISWSVTGNLPPGVALDQNGLLSGYIQPAQLVGIDGPAGYDGDVTYQNVVVQQQEYDYAPYDFPQQSQSLSYSFTVRAFDGANYDLQNYVIHVVSRSDYTADNGDVTVDDSYLTVDAINVYDPILLNANVTVLPTGRSGSNYAYKFEGYDFQGDSITYSLVNTAGTFDCFVSGVDAGFDYNSTVGFDSFNINGVSTTNLPGLKLDASTGWLYGTISPQNISYQVFTFGVLLSKIHSNVTYYSNTYYFNLPVSGNVNNQVIWDTDSDLGTINNGSVSELIIKSHSRSGLPMVYRLVDRPGIPARLLQGLKLLPTGEISGRVSFEAFSIDDYTTTLDGGYMTFDRVYSFTVESATNDIVYNDDGTIGVYPISLDTKVFKITVDIIDIEPYDNLYLRSMPSLAQRQIYNSVISSQEIFPPDLIYRPDDPWFGINQNIEMLFLPGLRPSDLNTYANAMIHNHYTKVFNFGTVDSAVVLDENYNVKYEVVYVNLIDPGENSLVSGPPIKIDLTNVIANPYIDSNGNTYKIVYPNSSENMIDRLIAGVGYYDQSSLPSWMTSNQLGSSTGTLATPLGYKQAVVLAYTVPGAGQKIAYRLRNSGINFDQIEFKVDRYFLDDYYTNNFDTSANVYYKSRETTFDVMPLSVTGPLTATVTYAVSIPFAQINGNTVANVNSAGGLDSVTDYQTGDTIIFAKQENFSTSYPYDGWISYNSDHSSYTVIPGYLEKAAGVSTVNQRGGVWKVTVTNGIVNLNFVQEILPNQKVRVVTGGTYNNAVLYYSQNLQTGQTVPYYAIFNVVPNKANSTTFNGGTTRFISYRDQYYAAGTQDKYVNFPQYGVFD